MTTGFILIAGEDLRSGDPCYVTSDSICYKSTYNTTVDGFVPKDILQGNCLNLFKDITVVYREEITPEDSQYYDVS